MNKVMKILFGIEIGLVIIILVALYLQKDYFDTILKRKIYVPYEFIGHISVEKRLGWGNERWVILTEGQVEYYQDIINVNDFDFEKYNYILVDEHEIVELYYRVTDVRGRFSRNPQFYAKALMKSAEQSNIYLYRIREDIPIVNEYSK